MSNNSNNNVTSNVYNNTSTWRTTATMARDDEDEMEMLLHQSNNRTLGTEDTTINIENDMEPGTSQQHLLRQQLLQQIRRDGSGGSVNATRNNMGTNTGAVIGLGAAGHAATNGNASENTNTEEGQRIRNILSMFREARHQLHRSQSVRDPQQHAIPATANGEPIPAANTHPRTWRENLYDVLASPVTPRSNVFRTFFTNPSSSSTTNVRYNSLPTNDLHIPQENFHFLLNRQNGMQDTDLQPANRNGLETQSSTSGLRLSRQSSRLTDDRSVGESVTSPPQTPAEMPLDNGAAVNGGSRRQSNATTTSNGGGGGGAGGRVPPQRQTSGTGSTAAPTIEMDDADTNAVGELIVKLVSHFVRYLPFIFILFVKFIHDHLLGILDLILLHGIMYQINKSLKEQIAKLTQKSYGALIRDMVLVVCVISYRFLLATSTPDPFGLLINPPGATITLDLLTSQKSEEYEGPSDALNRIFAAKNLDDVPSSSPTKNPLNSTISVTKTLSLGVLLYYVAVNDLILKLLTQLVKIIVTLMPTKVIRHKSRLRLYALVEYVSQFYRALVPMRQWFTYLFESYTGLEVISGILFSAFYMGAKGFELVERGKSLKKALINFIRNMDYDRKPTKDELEAAGTVCPICHDPYTTPVVLECSHIFCDECVNTWFKREQTCPMCRAKVSEDPTWQDGATTYFYQLC